MADGRVDDEVVWAKSILRETSTKRPYLYHSERERIRCVICRLHGRGEESDESSDEAASSTLRVVFGCIQKENTEFFHEVLSTFFF